MPPVTPTRIRATGTLCRWRSHLSEKRTGGWGYDAFLSYANVSLPREISSIAIVR